MNFVSRIFSPIIRSPLFQSVSRTAFSRKSYLALYSTLASMVFLQPSLVQAQGMPEQVALADVGVYYIQGRRRYMEDVTSVLPDFVDAGSLFCGVFDGHAGKRASMYAAELVPQTLRVLLQTAQLSNVSSDGPQNESKFVEIVYRCMREAVLSTDKSFCKLAHTHQWRDGTTALSAFIYRGFLFVSNTGDSRAVLCSRGSEGAFPVTRDHKPNDPEEQRRILHQGGFVAFKSGAFRVNGILAMSRAVGDCFLKPAGVTAEPDLFYRRLSSDDEYLVIASDGLWDALTAPRVYEIVREESAKSPQAAAAQLVERAYLAGSMDNISVVVVDLRNMTQGAFTTRTMLQGNQ
jgi:protein phosphatase 1L